MSKDASKKDKKVREPKVSVVVRKSEWPSSFGKFPETKDEKFAKVNEFRMKLGLPAKTKKVKVKKAIKVAELDNEALAYLKKKGYLQ